MYVYRGDGYEGVTIVGFGVSLNVADGKPTVEYNGMTGGYYQVLESGQLSGRVDDVKLDDEQLAWLREQKAWVKTQIDDAAN